MQLTNTPGKLVLPFANAGAKNTIPTASQIGITAGAASLTDGFPPLTRTPIAAGGVPPSGLDMNGILYALSAALRWTNAGGGYVYDSTFANDSNVGGYPKGARILRSDGLGYWLNTAENNTTDPEAAGSAAAGWVPDLTNGIAAVTMTSANVTLTPAQYGKPIIVLSGVLTANLNLIFPNLAGEWTVVNNCTGAFTVTAKTAAGTGAVVTPGRTRIIWGNGTNIAGAMNEVETPPQFDSTTKIATMAALQRALGNFQGLLKASSPTTLTAADAGKRVVATNTTITLPLTSSVSSGSAFSIFAYGANGVTVNRTGADTLTPGGGISGITSLFIPSGAECTFTAEGGVWEVTGTGVLSYSLDFTRALSANGYQKLPGGLIIQWGTSISSASADVAVTFPVAFPSAARAIVMGQMSIGTGVWAGYNSLTASGFNVNGWSATATRAAVTVPWVAIGY